MSRALLLAALLLAGCAGDCSVHVSFAITLGFLGGLACAFGGIVVLLIRQTTDGK